ncbi:Serine/threonine protein kinase [Amycolatopsis marina]|uniref:non-specific serine/threonine protein kinase n=1 Tax=Amycolatopsis marina TaxID=490629 RepID=A0A1I1B4F4_9PSEU|nr:Serine/threonine protein kinase [Amycolatopsis marina]
MGVVWRAVDERLERSVAVKQILTQPGLSEAERVNVRQRAMREAKNAARFQHPNAIVVFDIAEHDGDPCLVMEYLPSKSLSAIIAERGPMPMREVSRIGEQVAAALVAAHRSGLVHRDVKPGNILIDETGTAKITDFGISRAAGDLTLTQTGLIGGTPAYLAPELARGADPAPSSDVFALGATLYHAIEGQAPYGNNANQLALLYSAANGKVIPPARAGQATALLMSLLRSEPDERPTMLEARDRLAAISGGEVSPAATMVSPPLPHGGRQPAAPMLKPDTPGNGITPPWQRTPSATAVAPASPPPTSTFSATPPATPPRGAAMRAAGNGSPPAQARQPRDRRKPLIFGAIAASILVLTTVLIIALNSGGDEPNNQAQNPAPSTPQETSSSAPVSSQPSNGAPVKWGPAGNVAVDFYNGLDNPAAAWNLLSPGVQQSFGSQESFADYWDDYEVVAAQGATAYKHANNEDGSVDIRINVEFEDAGQQQKTVRVIDSGGKLLIDSDPR